MIETNQPNPSKQTPASFVKLMSISVQKLSLPKTTVYYSLGKKVSNSGFFNNDRFLLLNSAENTFQYFSKSPKGLPLMYQSQLVQLGKAKAIVNLKQATSLICQPLGMKISTMVLQFDERGKKDKWVFEFHSSKMMHEWIDLINKIRKGQKLAQLPKNPISNKIQSPNNVANKNPVQPSTIKPQTNNNNTTLNKNQQPLRDTPSFLIPPKQPTKDKSNPNNSVYENPNHNNTFQQSFGSNMAGGRANQTQPLEKTNNNMSVSRPKSDYPSKTENQPQFILDDEKKRREREQIKRQQEERIQRLRIQAINNQSSRANFNNYPQSRRSNNNIPNNQLESFDNASNKESRMFQNHQIPKNNSLQSQRVFSQQPKNYSAASLNKAKSNVNWNHQWCSCAPTRQLQFYQRFVNKCQHITKQIIDQIPFKKRDRQHSPLDANPPFNIYKNDGIVFIVHMYTSDMMKQSKQYNFNAPLLYDEETYEQTKRQFENYNLILSVTGNQKFIKVPLSCYIEYKGTLTYCKAQIPYQYRQVDPLSFEDQFQVIEALIKVKFPLSDFCCFEEPRGKYILLNDLATLIPKIPSENNLNGYFCKQFLLNWEEENLYYKSAIIDAHNFILRSSISEFLQRMQSLQSWVCCSNDLSRELSYDGISQYYITDIYRKASCSHLKKILVSQLVSKMFVGILSSQLNILYQDFPTDRFQKLNLEIVNNLIIQAAHSLIDEMFSYSLKAENIWKVIVYEINKKFKLVISKEDVIPGYILSALSQKMGIIFDFKCPQFNRKQNFFVGQRLIPRAILIKFIPKITRYNSSFISPQHQEVRKILDEPPNIEGFNRIVALLDLQNKQIEPSAYQLIDPITLYLCNFIPFDDTRQFDHLDIYQEILKQPHTYYSLKISLLAIKWSIKRKNLEIAYKIFEDKCQENSFWLGQFNSPVSQFYDFFSMYYASVGNYEEAIKLGKSSLVNVIKILSTTSLSTADKHYQLGNIYFKMGKKEQALKQYSKTKSILSSHEQKNIPQYGVILLKMSLLYLNFGKIKDCVMNSFEAIKIFDGNEGSQKDEIQIYQILIRAYEITRQTADMMNVGAICSQKFNATEDPIIFQRMAKIVIYPKLCSIGTQQSKSLQNILFKLQELQSQISSIEAFDFLHKIALKQSKPIMKKLLEHIDNIVAISQQIKRKDLLRKHKSLVFAENRNDAVEFLVLLEAVCQILGYGFMLGSLRENYYD